MSNSSISNFPFTIVRRFLIAARESMRTRRRFFQFVAFAKFKFRYQRFRKPVKVMLFAITLSSICFYVFSGSDYSHRYDAVQVAVKNETMTPANVTPRLTAAMGALNIHVWREVCGSSIQNLRQYLLFPHHVRSSYFGDAILFSLRESSTLVRNKQSTTANRTFSAFIVGSHVRYPHSNLDASPQLQPHFAYSESTGISLERLSRSSSQFSCEISMIK